MYKDFEDFLMMKFAEGDGRCILDDDMPDAFSNWLCDMEPDDFIKYGNEYANTFKIAY